MSYAHARGIIRVFGSAALLRVIPSLMLLTLFLSLLGQPAAAEIANPGEMSNVASNWVTEKAALAEAWDGMSVSVDASGHELWYEGVLVGRYFDVFPQGYVLVPVLKELSPVKLYSDQSNLGPDQDGGIAQMVAELLYQRMEAFRTAYGSYTASVPTGDERLFGSAGREEWARLEVPAKEFRASSATGAEVQAGPLLTVSWYQGSPYNLLCPYGDGGRTVVGCVATATSQIMKYWEWPVSGLGSHYYTWEGDNSCGSSTPSQILVASFADDYDWANMPDDCDGGCTTTQNNALAELNYEVGVAHNMDYGACGSGAATSRAAYILPTFFKYKSTTSVVYRSDYTQQEWFDQIRTEIDAGRPIQYRINLHSIVCDGYSNDNTYLEFHMNYGWNDSHNAWYVLDELYCSWIDGDVCPWEEEYMVIGIEPQYDPVLSYAAASVDDPAGNGNGLVEPGEAGNILLRVRNDGNDATGVTASISTTDPYVTISTAGTTFDGTIGWGDVESAATPCVVEIDPGCPDPYWATIDVSIDADGGHTGGGSFLLYVGSTTGFADDLEAGEGFWTHENIIGAYTDEWHVEVARYHSAGHSFKMGGAGTYNYSNNADGALYTPPLLLPVDAKLAFWHYISAEEETSGVGWDGGAVFLSEGGADYELITPVEGYTHYLISNSSASLGAGAPCYSGHFDWNEQVFDLSAYSGLAQVMFRFGSDGAVNDEGWYVDDIWIGNTLDGANVSVHPAEGASVTFGTVTDRGTTTMDVSNDGPEPPGGYNTLPSDPPAYYTWATDATFGGPVTVCLSYDDADLTGDESRVALMLYDGEEWTDATSNLDTDANEVCGEVSSFGPFLVAERTSCCVGRVGDANFSGDDEPTIGDISALIDMLFVSEQDLPCLAEADINASGGPNPTRADITISDISKLIDYMFITGHGLGLADCQ